MGRQSTLQNNIALSPDNSTTNVGSDHGYILTNTVTSIQLVVSESPREATPESTSSTAALLSLFRDACFSVESPWELSAEATDSQSPSPELEVHDASDSSCFITAKASREFLGFLSPKRTSMLMMSSSHSVCSLCKHH